jgi:hypothetical protein
MTIDEALISRCANVGCSPTIEYMRDGEWSVRIWEQDAKPDDKPVIRVDAPERNDAVLGALEDVFLYYAKCNNWWE